MFSTVAKTFLSKTADALATSGRIAGDPYRLHHSFAALDNLRNDSYPGIDGMRFCGLPAGAVLLNNNTCDSVGVDTTSYTLSTPCVNCNWQEYGIVRLKLSTLSVLPHGKALGESSLTFPNRRQNRPTKNRDTNLALPPTAPGFFVFVEQHGYFRSASVILFL
jgi:hypothetical protein